MHYIIPTIVKNVDDVKVRFRSDDTYIYVDYTGTTNDDDVVYVEVWQFAE